MRNQTAIKVSVLSTVVKFAIVSSMVSIFAFALFFAFTNLGVRDDVRASTETTSSGTDKHSKKKDTEATTSLGHTRSDLEMPINSIDDIQKYLENLNLEEKYNYQKLYPMPDESYLVIQFHNPDAHAWQCDLFDVDGNIVRTYVDIYSDFISIDKTDLDTEGKFTYLLQDGLGTYLAGKLIF